MCLFSIFCCPLRLYLWHLMRQSSAGCVRRPGPRAHRRPPVPLPPREHRLSFTDENESGATDLRMVTSDQSQSYFFSLLPWELRLQIYEYILGGRLLHLRLEDRYLRRETSLQRYLQRYPCVLGNDVSAWDHSSCRPSGTPMEKFLPLLQSCRLVYVPSSLSTSPLSPTPPTSLLTRICPCSYNEAISMLYCANTFSFSDSECLEYFPTLVLRQRFEAIRSLKLDFPLWDFPSDNLRVKEHYDKVWRLIASLPLLCELRVKLEWKGGRVPLSLYWKANEATLLAPLKGFKGLKVFELEMTLVDASEISNDIDVGECRIHALGQPGNG